MLKVRPPSLGCGKSSFLSKLSIDLQQKLDMIPIIRFCGTTKITSQKDALVNSIITQIEFIFKFTVWKRTDMSVLDIFQTALNEASNVTEKKIVIIIDSIDQLESASRTGVSAERLLFQANIAVFIVRQPCLGRM